MIFCKGNKIPAVNPYPYRMQNYQISPIRETDLKHHAATYAQNILFLIVSNSKIG